MKFFFRIFAFMQSLLFVFSSRNELLLRIVALEQQLIVFKKNTPRPKLSRFDRILWVWFKCLYVNWQEVLYLVQPDTVTRWFRLKYRLYWGKISSRRTGKGKPMIDDEIVFMIYRLAKGNVNWCAPRIHGELMKLGFKVCERTVSRYLREIKKERYNNNNWMTFLRNECKGIAAMDFFTVPTLFFRQLYILFIISHDRRKIIHCASTYNPTQLWVSHNIKEAFSSGVYSHIKYMIHDRGSNFSASVRETMKSIGIESKRTSFRSPWQNGVAERWVGNCRMELMNHVIILNPKHADILLAEYVQYYNEDRTHYNLDKDSPDGRPIDKPPSKDSKIIAIPRLGGLHHKYAWSVAA